MPHNQSGHFAAVLASTVHDIKNSLTVLHDRIRRISTGRGHDDPDLLQLELEANRMNHCMMQLLALYKIDNDKFNLNIEEYAVQDIFDEVRAQQAHLIHSEGIELTMRCPEELMCFCDFIEVSNALGTILNNAQRYSRRTIALSASQQLDYVCFVIEDDGEGYSEALLTIDPADQKRTDWISGSTGLGLYFVATIASLHRNDDKKGYIRIDNNSRLGGARFRLFLP